MDQKFRWVQDLGAPSEPGRLEHEGTPLVVTAEDIDRADAEIAKGLHDVVFNGMNPQSGDVHYILGSIA